MTEEELIEKIADIIDREDKNSFALPCMDIANQILTLIREVGYRSPEEITIECPQCHREGFLSDYIIYKFDKDKQPQ